MECEWADEPQIFDGAIIAFDANYTDDHTALGCCLANALVELTGRVSLESERGAMRKAEGFCVIPN